MKHFVIEYDHDSGKIVSMVQYDDKQSAVDRLLDLQIMFPIGEDCENVVEAMMFEATSLDALKAAVPQYFGAR